MKRIILIIVISSLTFNLLNAQVCGTGQTLIPKTFMLGINPVYRDLQNTNADKKGLYLHAGYGIARGIDLGFRYGLFKPWDDFVNYIGGDIEFTITRSKPYVSLALGAHQWTKSNTNGKSLTGLDATLNFTYPIAKRIDIFSGVDIDYDLYEDLKSTSENESSFKYGGNIWIPVGLEFKFVNSFAINLETDIAVAGENKYHIFSLALIFYSK